MLHKLRHPLLTGALFLTISGFLSRFIGFFYRIYLSRTFGEEGMGIYQLSGPILSLSFALCSAGFQTTISKLVAEQTAKGKNSLQPLRIGLLLSTALSCLTCLLILLFREQVSSLILKEIRTLPLLLPLSLSIPFAAIHSCLNGYYYGKRKTFYPASSQLIEQLIRVGSVLIIANRLKSRGLATPISIAALGLLIGEICSCLYTAIFFLLLEDPLRQRKLEKGSSLLRSTLSLAAPLTANRLLLNMLQSIETLSIPISLQRYGYSTTQALSNYGVLTGMAMPILFFPGAITNSFSVMLLPQISEYQGQNNIAKIKRTISYTMLLCMVLGILVFGTFFCLGPFLGEQLYKSTLAGVYIRFLSFLCPFLYLDTTLSSILQGLGKATSILLGNTSALLLRLLFVMKIVPIYGMSGYLWGILTSQIYISIFFLLILYRALRDIKKNQPAAT